MRATRGWPQHRLLPGLNPCKWIMLLIFFWFSSVTFTFIFCLSLIFTSHFPIPSCDKTNQRWQLTGSRSTWMWWQCKTLTPSWQRSSLWWEFSTPWNQFWITCSSSFCVYTRHMFRCVCQPSMGNFTPDLSAAQTTRWVSSFNYLFHISTTFFLILIKMVFPLQFFDPFHIDGCVHDVPLVDPVVDPLITRVGTPAPF